MARRYQDHADLPDWPLMLCEKLASLYVSLEPSSFQRAVRRGEIPPARRLDGQLRWARPELDRWLLDDTNHPVESGEDDLLLAIATKLRA